MSDKMMVDLSGYKDRVGQRVMPGKYTVQVEDAESDTSSNGNPMINLWLRIVGGEFADATIVDRLTITPKALFRVVGFLQAIGMPTPKKKFQVDIRQFVGKVLDIEVDDGEPYMGRVKSEVRGYMKAARKAKTEIPDEDALESLVEPSNEEIEAVTGVPTSNGHSEPEDITSGAEESEEIEEIDLDSIDLR